MHHDICLVIPPFAQVDTPTLGAAMLAAGSRARGMSVRVIHANLMLAARTGYARYREVSNSNVASMLGERLFLPHAYPAEASGFDPPPALPASFRKQYEEIAPLIAPVLEEIAERILALRPRIVGFSSAYQQNLAASAIARRIKASAPEIVTVLGGPNAASPMAEALAEIFPWFDHFFSGEADIAFPDFCEAVLRGEGAALPRIIHCSPLADLQACAVPDFADYFADLDEARSIGDLPDTLPVALPAETSRGCWWGARNHCTFCGLNGATMAFREKPAVAALAEIDANEARWGVGRFALADNIMPLAYLRDLLPELASREVRPALFYEVKANLGRDALSLMKRAGIDSIQPGIESLSTPVLRLMKKGVSAHQNIALLRDCRALGIDVVWNYLYGFPGEAVEHYAFVIPLIPALEHLQPPGGCGQLMIDRFSPYFNAPDAHGIGAIAPLRAYRGLYPRQARLEDIAYHFEGSYSTALLEAPGTRLAMLRAVGEWRLRWEVAAPPELRIERTDEGASIIDTRRIASEPRFPLSEEGEAVLNLFDRPRSRPVLEPALESALRMLLDRGCVIEHEGKLLAIVTRSPACVPVSGLEMEMTA